MGVIGLRLSKATPAHHAVGPITAPDGASSPEEGLKAHRRRSLPTAVDVILEMFRQDQRRVATRTARKLMEGDGERGEIASFDRGAQALR
jgi:hypothetical protein